jgi:hypothetical protein
MKRIDSFLPALLAALSLTAALQAAPALAAAHHAAAATEGHKKSAALHQFSGTVSSVDKSSLTVAKSGKEAKTMVFVRSADTRTTGDLEKDAHVTVWYREDGGQVVAHRVVVKTPMRTASR